MQTRAFFDKIFKQDPSEKTRRLYQERVDAINALEPMMQALSDDQLRAKTQEFKQRVARGETLESLLPEAFAVSTGCAVHCCLLLLPKHSPNCTTAVVEPMHLLSSFSVQFSPRLPGALFCACPHCLHRPHAQSL